MTITIDPNNKKFQWETKHRPQTIDECILEPKFKQALKAIAAKKRIPNLILHSPSPGTGKTTVALALTNDADSHVMFVNGSDATLPFIREKMTPFATSATEKTGGKVIIIDEFDRAELHASHKHLRAFMEAHDHNCTFIITANDVSVLHGALRSRCRILEFGNPKPEDVKPMMRDMIIRMQAILDFEKVPCTDKKVLATLVKDHFPDFRSTTKMLDFYASTYGKIDEGVLSVVVEKDVTVDNVVDMLKNKQLGELRKHAPELCASYGVFIKRLLDALYPVTKPAFVIPMIEIIGSNNENAGRVENLEVHLVYMFALLIANVEFK